MSRPAITEVLETRLGQWADAQGLLVAWDNISFTPPSGIYLTSHDMPATPSTIDLAQNCSAHTGIYQVNVVLPAAQGRMEGMTVARHIEDLFANGTEMEGEGFVCYVTGEPAQYAGIVTPTTYTIPVSLNYRADITR